MGTYTARQSGTVGHEILADGEVVAWTVDERWAAVIVGLLNGAPHHIPRSLRSARTATDNVCPNGMADSEPTAREAISHLAFNGISLRWDFAGEPSDEVRKLVGSYFQDGEIVGTLGDLACRYVMKALADDHLGITGITIPETDSAARNERDETRPPERR
jgi:hypothetical protein